MTIKFEIYRDGNRVANFSPVGAIAIGPESVPIPGDVAFRDGLLVCDKTDDHATAVGLMWDCGPVGAYHVETTRLPPRDKPYNLNVELARFRLMRIVQKQEDWNLFDFPRAERFTQMFHEAQSLFADALGKLDTPGDAARLADQSLALSVELSEQLALFHGELLLNRRRASSSFVKHVVGCRVNSEVQNQKYKDTLAESFDYAVLPMTWKQLQPEEGSFNTEPVDDWVEMLARKRIPIIAGPLISLDEGGVPDWMFIWEHDFDTLREMAYEFVQKVVQRYRRAVSAWNVVSGLHAGAAFSLSFEQIIELTRMLVAQVKTLLPNAKTLVSITQPFGEYHARAGVGVPPMLYAEMVAQAGVNFEAFGLEVQMGVPQPGKFTRDLFQLSCLLDKFSTLGRPVYLTAVCAPSRNTPDPGDESDGRLDPAQGGRWHKPWDPQLQADWVDAVYKLAFSKPYVESVAWGNLADLSHTIPGGGLLDDMLQPKPSHVRLQDLREKLHQWHVKKST
ncbi:MAG TPA: endo-1,4-beta-xylanase [Tepidisphaeraceae bacterium]|nr:endo-1,4-beta-xylanase [Tepidisphaeraceae bacterium]